MKLKKAAVYMLAGCLLLNNGPIGVYASESALSTAQLRTESVSENGEDETDGSGSTDEADEADEDGIGQGGGACCL